MCCCILCGIDFDSNDVENIKLITSVPHIMILELFFLCVCVCVCAKYTNNMNGHKIIGSIKRQTNGTKITTTTTSLKHFIRIFTSVSFEKIAASCCCCNHCKNLAAEEKCPDKLSLSNIRTRNIIKIKEFSSVACPYFK